MHSSYLLYPRLMQVADTGEIAYGYIINNTDSTNEYIEQGFWESSKTNTIITFTTPTNTYTFHSWEEATEFVRSKGLSEMKDSKIKSLIRQSIKNRKGSRYGGIWVEVVS